MSSRASSGIMASIRQVRLLSAHLCFIFLGGFTMVEDDDDLDGDELEDEEGSEIEDFDDEEDDSDIEDDEEDEDDEQEEDD